MAAVTGSGHNRATGRATAAPEGRWGRQGRMSSVLENTQQQDGRAVALLRALLVADLVDSTAVVERLGDARAAEVLREHDRLARRLIRAHAGQEIDKTDGYLVMFERPVQAAAFALAYQRALKALATEAGQVLRARVGIHVGEVMAWQNSAEDIARGAKPIEVEGLAKPVAARLMGLALPGQVLLSATAYGLAHRAASELGLPLDRVSWKQHGAYRLKGVPEPVEVYEIGELDIAPFRQPNWSGKAHRATPFWRRPTVLAVQVLLLLALIAVPAWQLLRPKPAIAFAERDWIVMGDLRNHTQDSRFDQSLTLAARLAIEQSRHVNVLSPLRVRDSLRRMGRTEPAALDVELASEIALREGARAVLLPSIRESGAQLEVSMDLIDPNSAQPVFTEIAMAGSAEEVLAALGEVSERSRERLGEALQSIETTSEPLPQVTSSSLDALRAYALGNEQYNLAQMDSAESHFRQALALDPEFALALAGLSRVSQVRNDLEGALALAEQAHALRSRLSNREALFLDAGLAQLRFSREASAAWDALVELYPDFHQAMHNAAMVHYMEGRYPRMRELSERASVQQSITRPASTFAQGLAELALGRPKLALEHLDSARDLGFAGFTIEPATALMALGEVDAAFDRLNSAPPPSEFHRLKRLTAEIALNIDSGRWKQVEAMHSELRAEAERLHARADAASYRQRMAMELAVLSTLRHEGAMEARRSGLLAVVDQTLQRHASASPSSRSDTALIALHLAYQLARDNETGEAQRLLQATADAVEASPRSVVHDMRAVATARVSLAEGESAEALRTLDARKADSEILLVSVLRAEALAREGRAAEAIAELQRLLGARGRAYAEWGGEGVTLVENVLQLNLAHLRLAELLLGLQRQAEAREQLQLFRSRWPDAQGLEGIATWFEDLQRRSAE